MAASIRVLNNKLLACGCQTQSMAAVRSLYKWSRQALCVQPVLRIPVQRKVLPQISNPVSISKKLSTTCTYNRFISIRSSLGNHSFRRGPSLPHFSSVRLMSQSAQDVRNKTTLIYVCATGVVMLGLAYAGVPLYRIFCQATGRGGQAVAGQVDKVETMEAVKDRIIRIRFNADTASSMQWNFRPQQTEVRVLPGETALAFYSAKNPTDKPIVGISTYNVVPFDAGQYFNKIQCFCFEEQRLNPHEQVDMPVFFYIDPEFADDPKMENVELITLSYTFFEAKDGMNLPLPGYMQAQSQPLAST